MKFVLLSILLIGYYSVHGQNTTVNQSINLKEGTFYIYPEYFTSAFKLTRKGNLQQEYIVQTQQTTEWELEWINDHVYTLRYLNGGIYADAEK